MQEPLCPSSEGLALLQLGSGCGSAGHWQCHTVHNDISALLQLLDSIGGSACVLPQVLLADIVEGQGAEELCVCLQGPALGLDHCSLCLWEMTERG